MRLKWIFDSFGYLALIYRLSTDSQYVINKSCSIWKTNWYTFIDSGSNFVSFIDLTSKSVVPNHDYQLNLSSKRDSTRKKRQRLNLVQ